MKDLGKLVSEKLLEVGTPVVKSIIYACFAFTVHCMSAYAH